MTDRKEDYAARRAQLSAQITLQRAELGQAWEQLKTPIHYTETGIRAFAFLRNNSWIFAAIPAVFSITSFFFGRKKNKVAPVQTHSAEKPDKGFFRKMVGHATNAFHFYRRVKPFIS